MIRRLPIYLLVDCSASMRGDPIASLESGIRSMHAELMGDPYAVEYGYLSVIAFGERAEQLTPLTEVVSFTPPALPLFRTDETRLGAAIYLLDNCRRYEGCKTTETRKGDWNPVIFVFIDGPVTDVTEFDRAVTDLRATHRINTIVAVCCGDICNQDQLRQLTDTVVAMRDLSPNALSQFFKHVS